MKSRNNKKLTRKVLFVTSATVIPTLLLLGIYFYRQYAQPAEEIFILKGTVTEKSPAIADTNQFMTINGITLQVSESGLKSREDREKNFKVDAFSIKRGDTVEVHYLKTGDGTGTLRCKSCFIKKDNTIFRPIVNGKEL